MGAVLARLDAFQRTHSWFGFPFAVLKKFGEDQAGNLAALIAYYAIFSVFPLLLAMSTVLPFVLHGHPHLQAEFTQSALKNLPAVHFDPHPKSGGSIVVLVVGLVLSLWSGLGVAKSAQTAFNTVYLVSHTDRPNFLQSTLRALGLVVVGGVGLLVTTAISSASATAHSLFGLELGVGLRIVGTAIAVTLNTALFLVLFRWLTVRHVRWRDSLPGAVLSAVVLQVLQMVASAFIAHKLKGASTTYGKDIAGVIVLLSWFYLQAQVVLFAVEVNVVRQFGLWPRALKDPPATEADFRTYEGYAERERYQPEEDVDTAFLGRDEQEDGYQPAEGEQRERRSQTPAEQRTDQAGGPKDDGGTHDTAGGDAPRAVTGDGGRHITAVDAYPYEPPAPEQQQQPRLIPVALVAGGVVGAALASLRGNRRT